MEHELPKHQISDGGRKDIKIPRGKEISLKEKGSFFSSVQILILGTLKEGELSYEWCKTHYAY